MADCFAMVSVTHHPTATTSLPPVKRSAARTPQPEVHPPVLLEEPPRRQPDHPRRAEPQLHPGHEERRRKPSPFTLKQRSNDRAKQTPLERPAPEPKPRESAACRQGDRCACHVVPRDVFYTRNDAQCIHDREVTAWPPGSQGRVSRGGRRVVCSGGSDGHAPPNVDSRQVCSHYNAVLR